MVQLTRRTQQAWRQSFHWGAAYTICRTCPARKGKSEMLSILMDVIKKLFGLHDDATRSARKVWEGASEQAGKWDAIGMDLADDCYQNGLAKGEIVRLSDITFLISENYAYNTNIVQGGFLRKMELYHNQATEVKVKDERGDIVFIHKNFVEEILK
jgi:hypothetical protein